MNFGETVRGNVNWIELLQVRLQLKNSVLTALISLVPLSGNRIVFRQPLTDLSKENIASIFTVEE
jgi:hypothetical protein